VFTARYGLDRFNHRFTYISCCSRHRDRSICRKIHNFVFFQESFLKYYSCVKVTNGTDNEYNFPFNEQRKLVKGVTGGVIPSAD